MIGDFLIIMLAMAISAFGGIYLGMRLQIPQKKDCSHKICASVEPVAQEGYSGDEVPMVEPTPEAPEDISEPQTEEDAVVRNAEAVLNNASNNASQGKELRKKMRNQDARYCILKQD